MDSVAILWDIENVTPSTDSLFVNGLLDYADGLGRVSNALAYADWTRDFLKKLSEVLAEHSFELIHVPRSRKNSSDMTLITQALELIHQFPHITKIILVTGDADFRPLLHALRKHNIEIHIICDAKSASEDLLILADEYKDYRELIPDTDAETEEEDREKPRLSFDESLHLLQEAVGILQKNRKDTSLGSVKVRMKLLNENFDETDFGCKSWKQYILKASGRGMVRIEFKDEEMYLALPEKSAAKSGGRGDMPQIFVDLTQTIRDAASKGGREGWVSYSSVSQQMKDAGIDFRKAEYTQFKKLVQAAEKRGFVESRNDGQRWYVKISEES